MDKKMLESYAIWAKKNLEQQVEVSLNKIGIHSDTDIKKMHISGDIATIDGDQTSYTLDFANKRKSVVRMVETDGYSTVISETAYTWFNRLIALRFMELHGYLSHGFRILSNPNNSVEPEILKNLNLVKFDLSLDMDYCDKLKSDNRIEELFRHVLLKQCQVLSKTIPMLFSENTDAYELLLPNTLITGESVLTKLLEIPEENFLDDVEVIGWLYQYYNTEQNKLVYNGKLSKEKIPKELIPAATTIYTPDWSVKYMVENSLGKLLSQMLPDFDTKSNWRYYLEDTTSKQEKTHSMSIEEVKFIDPCMGSGHILVYAFDVFMQIYRFCGYSDKDAVRSIIINNLYGLDIDKRAYQLACFAVIMRAQKYDKRFLRTLENEELSLNLSHFQNLHIENVNFLDKPIQSLIEQFKNADTYGSIIKITAQEGLEDYLESYVPTIDFDDEHEKHYYKLYQILTQKYEVICTNPPYLGSNRFNATLADYTKKHFNDEKSDLSMVMFRHCVDSLSAQNGYIAFITTSSWFSLSSFEKLRKYIIMNYQIESIVDYGTELFDGKVGHNPIVSWVLKKSHSIKKSYCY
ncbi:BREX-1 system adenine-specific DNA-methyltransferase PglX [Ruminococcus flavefaciens]|uniref:BREX-1 system adenine-specific DNA-methyltransferase PglX n=1 Tax=Ruminococcus flavefaciens TaxID=1265 RepID=UPI0004637028|nr:BREX-1 system adenine-specific DNA-methyltransferase PglX [Ruminococcus flavefaciens]